MTKPLQLPAEPGIRDIQSLRKLLLAKLNLVKAVNLDGSAVSRIDTAALQVLAAFVRDRRAAGRDVKWLAVSDTLREAAALVDLTSLLELPAEDLVESS